MEMKNLLNMDVDTQIFLVWKIVAILRDVGGNARER